MSVSNSVNRLGILFLLIFFASVLIACGDSGDGSSGIDDSGLVQSSNNTNNSHNSGMNCLDSNCHGQPATASRPQFTLAGTVYTGSGSTNIYPNVEIQLLKDGALWKTIPVNNLGNFYTTATIDWGSNLRARVATQNGVSTSMSALGNSSIGDCNGCHDEVFRIHP